MNVLVNGLSVTNASGRHVMLGHLSRLAAWTAGEHEYTILHHSGNSEIRRDLGGNVQWHECPPYTSKWPGRSIWELVGLPRLVSRMHCDLYFTPAGTVALSLDLPQISFAQNPWCLVRGLHRSPEEKVKAVLQRRAYKAAMKKARLMLFNSEFMRRAYRENAGFSEIASEIVYQGVDDDTFAAAESYKNTARKKNQILCVSVMAPHKGVETVLRGISLARQTNKIDIHLVVIGSWPHPSYKQSIKDLIDELGLSNYVTIKGFVTKEELHQAYAESKLFCLMSHCESFGIPGVEAQAFGTPVISSNCCAIPEVCGQGGVYPAEDDYEAVAHHFSALLTDENRWNELSQKARENAERFRWDACSMKLLRIFDYI